MNLQRWVARRESAWKQLDELLKRLESKRLRSLQADQIRYLASLYRSVSGDLARARTHHLGETLVHDLQNLTSRGYNQIYQGSRRQEWQAVREFYLWGLPSVIQSTFVYTAIATSVFIIAALIAWWFAWQDPGFLATIVPPGLISQVQDKGELWMGSILGWEPLASTGIMINNMVVSFRAIAGGITGVIPIGGNRSVPLPPGLFTLYALFLNGLLIGGVGTLVGQNNLAYPFWAFVFPHGALELPAIFLAGGTGLLIARAIIVPGQYRRADALKIYGQLAIQLVYGIVPLLFIAGIIEGFFSPSPLVPSPVKYLVGIGLFILLVLYCRRKKPGSASPLLTSLSSETS
jgi:uncharacterized membrane protein SpoIIM required for sporulation